MQKGICKNLTIEKRKLGREWVVLIKKTEKQTMLFKESFCDLTWIVPSS